MVTYGMQVKFLVCSERAPWSLFSSPFSNGLGRLAAADVRETNVYGATLDASQAVFDKLEEQSMYARYGVRMPWGS